MSDLRKAKLHITGMVQGVGFRPYIFGLAKRFNLNGWVRNTSSGVDIEVDGSRSILDEFIVALKSKLPPLARVDSLEVLFLEPEGFTTFVIVHSETEEGAFQPISPDVCVCADCLRELFDPTDRRFRYPFINCTNCGPRFSIITDIPYDRPNTTMAQFVMCPACEAEYRDPFNRRFHAQPVACQKCGPYVWLDKVHDNGKSMPFGDDAIIETCQLLSMGKIIAIKGLGGFHLACNATNEKAVSELRARKLRIDKPFALMVPDIATISEHCYIDPFELTLLESHQSPIVLLQRKPNTLISEAVAPRQHTLGMMLPYTPLHHLLFHTGDEPCKVLVMTSGNLSEEPIATDNEDARVHLSGLADAFLMHDRVIHTRCDDSVIRSSSLVKDNSKSPGSSTYFLRRSRGYAPEPIHLPFDVLPILAVGPELKNTFCLSRNQYAFLSHHIGDMENVEALNSFKDGISHFERLFHIHPDAICHDLHPDYLSTRYAIQRAQHDNLHLVGVQHHHAHVASCLADNGLDGRERVIGISFDGTGFGTDGAIWGGEFLVADYTGYERMYHLAYFPLPGGDAAIKHPAKIALALLHSLNLEWDASLAPVKDLNFVERKVLRAQLDRDLYTHMTSSMGRLFDAVAALADVKQRVNYEAQAAMELEALIDETESGKYKFEVQNENIELKSAMYSLLEDIHAKVPASIISARLHNGLAAMIRAVCDAIRHDTGIQVVVLSGGVWQNMALLGRTIFGLRADGFTVYSHRNVPTNDGGVSLGQVVIGAIKLLA